MKSKLFWHTLYSRERLSCNDLFVFNCLATHLQDISMVPYVSREREKSYFFIDREMRPGGGIQSGIWLVSTGHDFDRVLDLPFRCFCQEKGTKWEKFLSPSPLWVGVTRYVILQGTSCMQKAKRGNLGRWNFLPPFFADEFFIVFYWDHQRVIKSWYWLYEAIIICQLYILTIQSTMVTVCIVCALTLNKFCILPTVLLVYCIWSGSVWEEGAENIGTERRWNGSKIERAA